MPLPDFNPDGDLPPGIYAASWSEVAEGFGAGIGQRELCTRHLAHVYELAKRTGCLQRLVIFGSYVTAKTEPNDVDVILIMDDTFRLERCPMEARGLFDHAVRLCPVGRA